MTEDTITTLEDTNKTIKAIAAQLAHIERTVLKKTRWFRR